MVRLWLLLLSGVSVSLVAAAAEPGARAQVVGGTPVGIAAKSSVRLDLTDNDVLVLRFAQPGMRIPYQR